MFDNIIEFLKREETMEEDIYKQQKRFQRSLALKYAFGNVVLWVVFFLVLYKIGLHIFPSEFTLLTDAFLTRAVAGGIVLYSGISQYLYLTSDTSIAINKARQDKERALINLKSLLAFSEVQYSLSDKHWDAVKLPIPLIIFLFGVLVNNNLLLGKIITIGNHQFLFKQFALYVGFGIIALYIFALKATYDRYKWRKLQYFDFQGAVQRFEADNTGFNNK